MSLFEINAITLVFCAGYQRESHIVVNCLRDARPAAYQVALDSAGVGGVSWALAETADSNQAKVT